MPESTVPDETVSNETVEAAAAMTATTDAPVMDNAAPTASDNAAPAAESEDGAIIPGFVPTKASRSRLAFLSGGRAVPMGNSEPATAHADDDAADNSFADEQQMSIDEAIAKDRATAFGSGMPASSGAEPQLSPEASPESSPEPSPAPPAAEAVMVADSADELTAARRPFIPGTPAPLPEGETVPDTAPAGGKTSLINKISRLWTEKPQDETGPERREPDVEAPAMHVGPTDTAVADAPAAAPASSEASREDAAPSILDLPRADAMSRMPEPAGTTTLDRQADDLEIPAFLRRQAN
jgi:hypothetical protein